ncbi:Mu transposase C-terminal domain-containing protein [Streptomyces sp. WAC00263]|uniref:Mu transposase C-terminal domain-containing protein n=1 Tax=Streptomyces sp. WAC00263 TaxID=1917422 RepID=UPI001F50B4DD|nr:Mu transposase C-terminal domain-containing protein [Streptomyces sp. WAC00263]
MRVVFEEPLPLAEAAGTDPAQLRGPAVRRLLTRRAAGEFSTADVRLVACALGVNIRSVWRWLEIAEDTGSCERKRRIRFEIIEEITELLAFYRGNVKRVHEHLTETAENNGVEPVGLSTLHRAIRRDLTPGFMAAMRDGIPAARGLNPHLRRPLTCRNQVWEGDHKQAPLDVLLPDGKLTRPWVTWFIDGYPGLIQGYAVTPYAAHRGSVPAAMRASILRDEVYGPAGGVPELVRIDRGADFLSKTVTSAFGALDVPVEVVRSAHLKGGVERLNRTAVTRFFADLPRYAAAQKLDHRRRAGEKDPPLTFEAFVVLLHQWVERHNTRHVLARTGMTPLEAWQADPTPIRDIPREDLDAYMLEDDDRVRWITSRGIEFNKRLYIGPKGVGRVGTQVRLRWMPHHDHEIEVYIHRSNRHLGTWTLSDQAPKHLVDEVLASREEQERAARKALRSAARRRREKHSSSTHPTEPAQRIGRRMTTKEAVAELKAQPERSRPRRATGPAYEPRIPPAADWVVPGRPAVPEEDACEVRRRCHWFVRLRVSLSPGMFAQIRGAFCSRSW